MNWKWILGALLVGFGTPALFYGAILWNSQTPKIADLAEVIGGLLAMGCGFILIWVTEKRKK